MLQVIGIIIFVLLIGFSIGWHELGHLLPAKRFGVKVTEYMVGFGPTIWSRQGKETRYGLKVIPVGGYIRMIGMIPPAKPGTPQPRSRFGHMIEDAREASAAEVGPGDDHRVFYKLPVAKRITIMLGGPVMNLILSFLLFAAVLVGIGLPQPTAILASTVPCTPTVSHPNSVQLVNGACPIGSVASPARVAGLKAGDNVIAIGNASIADWTGLTSWLDAHPGASTTIEVSRNEATKQLPVTVAAVTRPILDDQGQPTGSTKTGGYLGISPSVTYVSQGWSAVPAYMWQITSASAKALVSLPVSLYDLVRNTLIGGAPRSANGPVSVVGVTRIGGQVAAMDEPLKAKLATFLGLLASLNLFLFLFNLLPIPPLDGGQIAGALYESLRRALAKLTGRPDPGPVDIARLLPVSYVVAAVLIGMGVIVIWADLVKPVSLG